MPSGSKWRNVLDLVTSVALLAAALAIVAKVSFGFGQPTPPEPPYAVGEEFERLDGVVPGETGLTAVLFIKSTCPYCTASMPFYSKLAAEMGSDRLIAIAPEPREVLTEYLGRHGLAPPSVLTVRKGQTRFRSTPMLLLIDRSFKVRGRWSGQLNEGEQAKVVKLVRQFRQSAGGQ